MMVPTHPKAQAAARVAAPTVGIPGFKFASGSTSAPLSGPQCRALPLVLWRWM